MRAQDYEQILQKTASLLDSEEQDGRWRWVLYRAIALNGFGRRQDALRLVHDFFRTGYQRDVLINLSQMILGGGAAYSELLLLRDVFDKHAARIEGDDLFRFRAETDFHLGDRAKALAAMAKLPKGSVPAHYLAPPAPENTPLLRLVSDAYVGDIDAVYRTFDDVRRTVVPGTVDDMRLVSIVGRLERSARVREQLKSSVYYEIRGAKLDAGRPMLIETMLYSGEEHLLDLHLHSMPFVDHFIVVEGDHSFTGIPKTVSSVIGNPRFAAFAHKITSIVIRFASFDDPLLRFPWFVEALHRNAAHATVLKGRENDIHIVSDVDEVLRDSAVSTFKASAQGVSTVRIREHKYFLNFQRFGHGDHRQMTLPTLATLCTGKAHAAVDPQTIRNFMSRDLLRQGAQILDGGWHFSSVVDAAGLAAKYANYSHVENTAKHNKLEFFSNFLEDMRAGCVTDREKVDYYGKRGLPISGYMAMPITPQTYPDYLANNPQLFWEYTLPFAGEEEWADVLLMLNRRGQ